MKNRKTKLTNSMQDKGVMLEHTKEWESFWQFIRQNDFSMKKQVKTTTKVNKKIKVVKKTTSTTDLPIRRSHRRSSQIDYTERDRSSEEEEEEEEKENKQIKTFDIFGSELETPENDLQLSPINKRKAETSELDFADSPPSLLSKRLRNR